MSGSLDDTKYLDWSCEYSESIRATNDFSKSNGSGSRYGGSELINVDRMGEFVFL